MHLDNSVYPWLVQALKNPTRIENYQPTGEDIDCVKSLLINEKATTFLIVWSIMERELFEKKFSGSYIENYASTHAILYNTLKPFSANAHSFDPVAEFFHDRYQDELTRKILFAKKRIPPKFNTIIGSTFSTLSDEDKLCLLLFVTFRYRNNIFHGNKNITEWLDFSEQIENCIKFMMALIDAYHEHKSNNS